MQSCVSDHFDSGNIEFLNLDSSGPIPRFRLAIRPDVGDEFSQWFHFRLTGLGGKAFTVRIENAGNTSYPRGWEGYDVATSVDRQHWYRTPARFDETSLNWEVPAGHQSIYFAYFAPYSLERHADLVARCTSRPGVVHEALGQTLDGRDLDYLMLASAHDEQRNDQPRQVWCIGRQHPGESMAGWWMQGWLERLTDQNDAAARALRRLADIHVVPNMNPDGVFRGHLRTNACGANLNREWAEPSMARSPEVFTVRQRMQATGVDLSLDVHGDEILPYNFIAGTEGVPSWTDAREQRLLDFKHTLAALNPDFQVAKGYPRPPAGKGNLTFCSNQLAERFGALSMTLEMPFKDTADTPMPGIGWSPERCRKLGSSCVEAVLLNLTQSADGNGTRQAATGTQFRRSF